MVWWQEGQGVGFIGSRRDERKQHYSAGGRHLSFRMALAAVDAEKRQK